MKNILLTSVLATILGLGACTKTQAPGTHPNDMTAEQHHQACMDHQKVADADKARADKLDGGKGTNTANVEKDEHQDIAQQHEKAAKTDDPNIADCPM